MMIGTVSQTQAQTQTQTQTQLLTRGQTKAEAEAEPPSCGAKLEGGGIPLRFAATLPEADRLGLLASLHLALNDSSGRGNWPLSEIAIALPCEIASFPVGEDTWVISAGEGYAPPRWARAKGQEDTFYLTPGPSITDAAAWSATPGASAQGLDRTVYYLVAAVDGLQFAFEAYQGAPSGAQLAQDLVAAISGKSEPFAVYDSVGNAASLFLVTQSRRTSQVFLPEKLSGEHSAVLYGPDGFYFSPAPGGAVLLRGSDLTCDARYGAFERSRLGVINTEKADMDLACYYETDESSVSIFSSRLPGSDGDRRYFEAVIKQYQDDVGVKTRLPAFKTGPKEIFQAGRAWVDKSGLDQGVWFMRRGDYVYEIRTNSRLPETKIALDAAKAFALSNEPEAR